MKKLLFALFIALIAFGVAQATWTFQLIDSGESATSSCKWYSLWIDPDTDYPYIAYSDCSTSTGYLQLAHYNGSSWEGENVSDDNTELYAYVDLAVGSDDKKWISAFLEKDQGSYPRDLVCWYEDNGDWTRQTVDSSSSYVGEYTSICVDSNNQPIISYYDAYYNDGGNVHGILKVAWRQSNGQWNIDNVDTTGTVGKYTSVAFFDGHVYVSYYDQTNSQLKAAYRVSDDNWDRYVVDNNGDCGRSTSIQVKSDGYPGIAYYEGEYGNLKFAKRTRDGNWDIENVDNGTDDVGMYCSLQYDGTNFKVAYYNATDGDLCYAGRSGTTWTPVNLYTTGTAGMHCDMDLNTSGYPRIAFGILDGNGYQDLYFGKYTYPKAAIVNQPTLTKVAKPFSISTLGNPAKNTVTCGITMPFSASVTLSLYDLSGRMVQQKQVNAQEGYITESMDVSNVSNGVYVLVASSNNQRNTSRVIISH